MRAEPLRWLKAQAGPEPNQVRLLYGSFPAVPATRAVVERDGEAVKIGLLGERPTGAVRASLRWRCALVTLPFELGDQPLADAFASDPQVESPAPADPNMVHVDLGEFDFHDVEIAND